jgi:cobalt-zinc-cadmium efflux system membrane fusion protein
MSDERPTAGLEGARLSWRTQTMALAVLLLIGGALALYLESRKPGDPGDGLEVSSQSRPPASNVFRPTAAQWATLKVAPVKRISFRSEHVTEGKIAVNEDRSTLVFTPYSGRVTKLLAKPGDHVAPGQPLFTIEATDVVQVQNDFLAAVGGLNKARSQLRLAQIVERRTHDLYEGKAIALKEWQNAQNELTGAQNDLRSAQAALEAVHNRLRLLGRSDAEIARFEQQGRISAETQIVSPIAGTVVQRKAGPGQYLSTGGSDPVFVIGDLSTVWLVAYVRENDAPRIHVGQTATFTVLAYPDRTFQARIDYVAAALDPTTRRLTVRATIDNKAGLLKPEMFANVTVYADEGGAQALAVPRDAVIFEGATTRVWVAHENGTVELRRIKLGLSNHDMLEVADGLQAGDKVVTQGSLFIDRVAAGS